MKTRTAKSGLLGVVSNELEPFGFVLDHIGGDGRVVGHLLNEKGSLATPILIRPSGIEEPKGEPKVQNI